MVTYTCYGQLRNILSYDDICGKYNVRSSSKIYDKIMKNIPLQMIKLVKEQEKYSTIFPKIHDLMIENVNFADTKCSHRFLRNCVYYNFVFQDE